MEKQRLKPLLLLLLLLPHFAFPQGERDNNPGTEEMVADLLERVEAVSISSGESLPRSAAPARPPARPPSGTFENRIITRGLDAPEYGPIKLVALTHEHYLDDLAPSDRVVLLAAANRINDLRESENDMRVLCNAVLSSDRSDLVPTQVARDLVAVDRRESERIKGIYEVMLLQLSPEGAEYIDAEKTRIHRNVSANDPDWVGMSETDGDGFLDDLIEGCRRP